jgi:hypothetical protein
VVTLLRAQEYEICDLGGLLEVGSKGQWRHKLAEGWDCVFGDAKSSRAQL